MKPPSKPKYNDIIASMDPALLESWKAIQDKIKGSLVFECPSEFNPKFLAGADISFSQTYPTFAAATVAVYSPQLELVGLKTTINKIEVPYVPGFLAFREVDAIQACLKLCLQKIAERIPNFGIDLVFVDGNGLLHPRECGLACHLGAVLDTPTIGCAKTIFAIDGINKNTIEKVKADFQVLGEVKGATADLVGDSGRVWGVAVKNSKRAYDPLIVSPGFKIDIKSAVAWTIKCSKKRVVEPIRAADLHSRNIIAKFDRFYATGVKNGLNEAEIVAQFEQKINETLDDNSKLLSKSAPSLP